MSDDRSLTERILEALRPFACTRRSAAGPGDVVIPQTEIALLVRRLSEVVGAPGEPPREVSPLDLFEVLRETRRLSSLQDQARRLREVFLISKR